MKTDILIVSCAKHFDWLRFALKSIDRFARGFRQCKVLIPENDHDKLQHLLGEFSGCFGIPIRIALFRDWTGKGFLRHEHIIMTADEWTDADFILHTDSDCLFVEPFSPEDYFVDGKPVLMHARYEWLKNEVQANLDMWRVAVESAIGPPVEQETMRRHPAVHPRLVYAVARHLMVKHTGKPVDEYIQSCREEFPQTFAEHPTLGAVAWREMHDAYHWIDHEQLHKTNTPWPASTNKLTQWWSHQSPDLPQEPIFRGQKWRGTPAELLKLV